MAVQMLIDAADDRGPLLFAKLAWSRISRMAGRAFKPPSKKRPTARTGWTLKNYLQRDEELTRARSHDTGQPKCLRDNSQDSRP